MKLSSPSRIPLGKNNAKSRPECLGSGMLSPEQGTGLLHNLTGTTSCNSIKWSFASPFHCCPLQRKALQTTITRKCLSKIRCWHLMVRCKHLRNVIGTSLIEILKFDIILTHYLDQFLLCNYFTPENTVNVFLQFILNLI